MFRRLGDKDLIKTQAQKISKIDIYVRAAQRSDPKIKQGEISQNAVEKFERECAIWRMKGATGERT
jgi:hypothetical protein